MTTTTGRGLAVTSPKLIFTESGKHCYAYSGSITVNNDSVECLKFKTGNDPIIADFSQAIDYTNVGGAKFTGFTIKLNGVIIATNYEATDTAGKSENNNPSSYRFLIPPLTEVITIASTDSAADNPFFPSIVGEVYG